MRPVFGGLVLNLAKQGKKPVNDYMVSKKVLLIKNNEHEQEKASYVPGGF